MSQPPIGSAGETYNSYENVVLSLTSYIGILGSSDWIWGTLPSGLLEKPLLIIDPSIGTAGMIPGQPGKIFRNTPGPIGSAGVVPGPDNNQWNPHVGTANEGEEQKHGFL